MDASGFTWQDGERTIRFGEDALADAPALLGRGFTLLTTARAAEAAPAIVAAAGAVHHVAAGTVDTLAADLRPDVDGELLVALGGGRPIDVAKALAAAAGPPVRAAAIPTTLSAAEMTRVHRHAAGVAPETPRVRPAVVLNDPELSAGQPAAALAASAANTFGHAVEAALTTRTSPVPVLAAARAVALLAEAYGPSFGDGASPDRRRLALAALLAGYALDGAGYGLHHVLAQSLVRETGMGHGPANALLLPHTIAALRTRRPQGLVPLEAAARAGLQAPDLGPDEACDLLARRLAALAGTAGLASAGIAPAALDRVAEAAAGRSELDLTPPRASAAELRAVLELAV